MKNKVRALIAGFVFVFSAWAQAFTLLSTNPNETGWATKTLNFNLNSANCPSNIGSLLNAATGLWNSVVTSSLTVTVNGVSATTPSQLYNGTAPDSPVIVCDPNFQTTTGQNANTTPAEGFIGGNAQPINYGGILLNVQAGAADNIAFISTTLAKVTIAHEMGHTLGLGHSADPNALMYYDATRKGNLTLGQDDIDGITYLYPRNEFGSNGIFGCGLISTFIAGGGNQGGRSGGAGGEGLGAFAVPVILFFLLAPILLAVSLLKATAKRKEQATRATELPVP